ncbi:MAG: hypothetical protein PHV28_12535, partial [Kiritimatiellae bacterium]|nr:hypothetical protein [Kiritimatiellia bacterium]
YAAYHGGVRRTLTLENSGKEKKYLTPFTECRFVPSFQTNLWHLGAGYIGPYKPFPTVGQARQVKEYKQSSKGLVLIHPDGKRGNFTHYRVKLDDQVVFPWWYSTIGHYREYHDRLWYLPDGYRMGLGTFGLETGKAVSVTDQFTFFDGDLFTFFDDVFAKDEDVARELASIPPPPKWTDDLLACMGGDYDDCVRWMTEMTDEGVVLAKYFGAYGWGDYPVDRNIAANQGGVITPQELRTYMQDLQAISPSRVKSCIYQIVISTSFFSKVFKDHPEWFRVHDRDGKRDSLFPGLNMNWQTMFNNADCRRWLVDMLCRSSDYLGTDTVYLDETQMTNTIDWERDQITLDSDTVKFWKELQERFREKGKMFYANGSGCPYADLNYMESPHELAPNRWRDWAGVGWGIGMMNRMRPGQRTSPLTWTKNLDYINRILALGWVPNPYLMCCINYLTTIRAVYQSGNLLPVNAKYAPDWKTDDQVEVESHTMKRADAKDVLLSFINRAEAQDIPVAVMLGSLGFGEGERINVWKLHVDTERYTANYRENLSDKELKANWREQGTVRNARITDPELLYSGKADGVFKDVIAKLGRDKIEQYLFTASPAAFYAVDDLPLNYFYTAQRKARIEGNRVKLQKKSDILLIDKARDFTAVTANGQPVATRRVRVGPLAGTLAALGPGEWTLEWKEIPRKPADETVELPFEGPKQITKVKPPVPFYDPERFEVKETNVVKDGVKIVKAAVYDKRLLHTVRLQTNLASTVTAADPEKLTLVAGPSRREYTVRDFETFSGFELEGARSVRLKFSHTFGDVISIYLGHITFNNPGKTNEFFTGFIVDYRVGGKYVKRVSMSTGLFHPAYTLTCPKWGTGRAPDEKIDLGEWINGPKERVFSMDLAKHAPEGWDGTAFLSLGTVRIMSGRSLKLEILSFNDANASDFCRVRPEPAEPLAWAPLKNGFFEHGGYGTLTMDFKWRTR